MGYRIWIGMIEMTKIDMRVAQLDKYERFDISWDM
jgi:hypothetical protein